MALILNLYLYYSYVYLLEMILIGYVVRGLCFYSLNFCVSDM